MRKDRITEMTACMLRQRCFFPVFPVPRTVPLDASLASVGLQMQSSWLPDLLVNPASRLPAFVKKLVVDSSKQIHLGINPGHAAHARNPSCAMIDIQHYTDTGENAYQVTLEKLVR